MRTKEFYVYAYLDPRKPGKFQYPGVEFDFEPFYIGKGMGKRWKPRGHLSAPNFTLSNKMKKIGLDSVITRKITGISEQAAFRYETDLIEIIGRKDLKTGPLLNLTDGGRGGSTGRIWKESTKEKIRQSLKGRKIPEEIKKKISESLKGRIFSEETKMKIREKCKGQHKGEKLSEEHKRKIGEASKKYWASKKREEGQ